MMQTFKIPFVDFKRRYAGLKDEILYGVDEVFSSGNLILGNEVEAFEAAIGDYLQAPYVLGLANGTDTIMLALKLFGIGAGDEVILPVNTFIATAGAVVAVNAKPVFCDVTDDLNIDASKIEALITSKTKAIIPVHLTGRPADMQTISKLAKRYSLRVIEDAAQSIGAKMNGKMTGTLSEMGSFSLHPLKNLHVYGDGGLLIVQDEGSYRELKLLRNHGLKDRDTCMRWGINSRLDSVQARVGMIGFRYLDQWNNRRRDIAKQYQEKLGHCLKVPFDKPGEHSVYHNFVVQTDKRDQLMQFLQERGIETKIHYPIPLHLQPAAAELGYKAGDFPIAEYLSKTMMSLPVYPELKDSEVDHIIYSIRDFYG